MATQHSKKSKKGASAKAKPAKSSAARKPVKKAVTKPASKAKPAAKTAAKSVKAKKTLVAKSKPAVKTVKAKSKVKPAVTKAKAVVSKASPVKAGKAPKSGAKTTSSKPVAKMPEPKKSAVILGSHAPKKPQNLVGSAKPKPSIPSVGRPLPTSKAMPVMTVKNMGSKATDAAKKPTVSTNKHVGPSNPEAKAKPNVFTPSKHITQSKKPFEKMTEKKDFKPSTMVAAAEEPHKSRYSDKELEEFDQLIDQKLIVAREQLEFYLKQLEDMAENPDNKIKGLDDGLSTLESERVSSLASRQQKLIQHLENAKIRIKNKVYGICRETGKLISKERLRAVPHATLSIEAKQAQN